MIKIRRDRNAIVLFSNLDGTKVRLALGTYPKAAVPELVDIKITDHCLFGCDFCYQGSTPEGQHASMENIVTVVDELRKAKVFEVALGGGEPTDHPDFAEILEEFRGAGIVPNFTTKSLARVRQLWPQIKRTAGAIAYSAETAADVLTAAHHLQRAEIPRSRVNLHYVMGLQPQEQFVAYLLAAYSRGMRVTLLGYKAVGRGALKAPIPYGWWIEEINRLTAAGKCPSLSVDTSLAKEFDGRMPVGQRLYHTRDGAYSMYIDAVAMTFGSSSYDPAEELVPFRRQDWRELYQDM